MKPTLGRIVHYVGTNPAHPGEEHAAIVTKTYTATQTAPHDKDADLVVFGPWPSIGTPHQTVPYDELKSPGSWHWPEREP